MEPNVKDFHKSLSRELQALKDRVRNLIGDAHWVKEGEYKESLLRSVLRRMLPPEALVATGFVVEENQGILCSSPQIDILVINQGYPILFKEGDFVITTRWNVLATIEVKTSIKAGASEEIKQSKRIGEFVKSSSRFNGLFSFGDLEWTLENSATFRKNLKSAGKAINHICFGNNYFVKYWENSPGNPVKNGFRAYEMPDKLAPAYFFSNLISTIYPNTEMERPWFLYPLERGKEVHRLFDVILD